MDFNAKDWIEHPAFGLGRVTADRGDRLDIQFINAGPKTILKAAQLKPTESPYPDFRFPFEQRKSRTRRTNGNVQVDVSFEDFMKSKVIPHQAAHPDWQRLDGWDRDASQAKEGNRSIFGRFRHVGKTWKVDADTQFAPLMEAYMKRNGDPFVEMPTNTTKGVKLQTQPESESLYIYLVP